MKLEEAAGWYGVVAILAGFASNSLGYLTAQSLEYQLLNFTGALGLIVVAQSKKDWPLVALNVIWAAIAAYSLAKIVF